MNKKILILSIINIFSCLGYSLIAPLFPPLANDKKIGENIIGLIISFYPLSDFLSTLLVPYLIYKFTRKKIFYFATILEGSCTIFYGFLKYFNNFYLFLFFSILTRILHGTGAGITSTLVYSLGSTLSESNEVPKSLAMLEMADCVGIAFGPIIGSILFHFGGYSLPFWILGLLFLISIMLIKYLNLENIRKNEKISIRNFVEYFKFWPMIITSVSLIIYVIANVYYFPSLINHLRTKWNFSVEMSSLMFIIPMFVYLITLFFVDIIVKKFGLFLNIFIALFLLIFVPPFIYPLEFLPQTYFSIFFGLMILGLTSLFINVQSLIQFGLIIRNISPELNNEICNDLASVIYNVLLDVGDFLGPILGGNISNKYGFKYSNIFVSLIGLTQTVIFWYYFKDEIIEEYFNGQKYVEQIEEFDKKDDYYKLE